MPGQECREHALHCEQLAETVATLTGTTNIPRSRPQLAQARGGVGVRAIIFGSCRRNDFRPAWRAWLKQKRGRGAGVALNQHAAPARHYYEQPAQLDANSIATLRCPDPTSRQCRKRSPLAARRADIEFLQNIVAIEGTESPAATAELATTFLRCPPAERRLFDCVGRRGTQ